MGWGGVGGGGRWGWGREGWGGVGWGKVVWRGGGVEEKVGDRRLEVGEGGGRRGWWVGFGRLGGKGWGWGWEVRGEVCVWGRWKVGGEGGMRGWEVGEVRWVWQVGEGGRGVRWDSEGLELWV